MNDDKSKNVFVVGIIAILVIAVDFLTKNIAHAQLQPAVSQSFIPGFIKLTLASNTGAAFSLGSNNALLMTIIASMITFFLIYWTFMVQKGLQSKQEAIGMGFLIGGACGNLLERFVRGRVTDFFDFTFMSFPIFNLADVCIDIGIILFLIAKMRNVPTTNANSDQ